MSESYEQKFAQKYYNDTSEQFFYRVEHEIIVNENFDANEAWSAYNEIQNDLLSIAHENYQKSISNNFKYSVELDSKLDDNKLGMIKNLIEYYLSTDQDFKGKIVRHFSEDK